MSDKGFTLFELIMVIVLIAVVAVVVTPSFKSGTSISVTTAGSKVADDIRYAQALAMSRHKLSAPTGVTNPTFMYRVVFNAGSDSYSIVNDADNDGTWGEGGAGSVENVREPSTGTLSFSVQLNSGEYYGITITSVGFASSTLEFDPLGRPYEGGSVLTSSKSVVLSKGGESVTITVTPYTGRVSVS